YVVFEYSGNEKKSFDKIFFTKTDFKNVPEDAKKVMIGLKLLKLSTAFFNYGALQVLGAEVLSDDKAKYCNALPKFSSKLIPDSLIFKKPKHRQGKLRLKHHWKELEAKLWPCTIARMWARV
ncbi:MAG: hypothetical protein IPO98_11685, partial [Saprospiraceae bacterium]|nr:hypothetical protein [Saprospiraceae bacterium]